jgi:hypothetical protein
MGGCIAANPTYGGEGETLSDPENLLQEDYNKGKEGA